MEPKAPRDPDFRPSDPLGPPVTSSPGATAPAAAAAAPLGAALPPAGPSREGTTRALTPRRPSQARASATPCKYVVVTGGVLSGLGKGITTSSIGRLLKSHGITVTAVKIDPYLNIDAGTMNPFEHGEVFVLADGAEADLDLGNYERFLDVALGRDNNITTGKVYQKVIEKERRGDYLGKTVQIVPHVVSEIREWIQTVARGSGAEVCLVEVGGTVGDIESMPFLEAVRQLHAEVGSENLTFVHTTLVPIMGTVGEQKTKPTQHSVKELRGLGIDPDVIVCRASAPIEEEVKQKISLFCDVPPEAVISAHDCASIYQVPLLLHEQGLTQYLADRMGLRLAGPGLGEWKRFLERVTNPPGSVSICIVGKYTHLADSYLSVSEAFRHAGAAADHQVKITWVEAEALERDEERAYDLLARADGILIPGGFGARGAEGKIRAAGFARVQGIPYLGICYGFQLALVEFARSVLGLAKANTTENDPKTPHPVICILPEQLALTQLGGTMRLGASDIELRAGTQAHALYGKPLIQERHRHRFEVNPDYIPHLEAAGMHFSGRMPGRPIMEVLELPGHPYFLGGQFHPEFLSRPERPAPLFAGLVAAAVRLKEAKRAKGVESVRDLPDWPRWRPPSEAGPGKARAAPEAATTVEVRRAR